MLGQVLLLCYFSLLLCLNGFNFGNCLRPSTILNDLSKRLHLPPLPLITTFYLGN